MSIYHGPELDLAMDAAAGGPEAMGVCITALDARVEAFIDSQIEEFKDADDPVREQLIAAGTSEADAEILAPLITLRAAIGGAFSYGIHVGMKLARNPPVEAAA